MEDIVKDNWGIKVKKSKKIKALYSDIYTINDKYILKITNINSSAKQELINYCVDRANKKGLPCPKILKTKKGDLFFSSRSRTYSVLSYIKGNTYDFKNRSLEEAARTLGLFHLSFKSEKELEYKIKNTCGDVYPYELSGIKYYNKDVESAVKLIERSPRFDADLPKQIGHFDYTPNNLIFRDSKMIGLIDFDIMRVSEAARDVAIAFYRLTKNETQKKTFLKYYNEVKQLSELETQSIHDLYIDEMKRKLIYTVRRYKISPEPFHILFNRVKKEKLI